MGDRADWRRRSPTPASRHVARGLASKNRFVISGAGGPERITGALVSAGLFALIGASPARRAARIDPIVVLRSE